MSAILQNLIVFIVVCWYLSVSSAHENDYLDTERNRKLLQEKPTVSIQKSHIGSFFFNPNVLKSEQTNEFSYREDVEDGDFLRMVEKILGGITEEDLVRVAQNTEGSNGTDTSFLKCLNDTMLFVSSINEGVEWAVQMFDAYGKPGSRTLQEANIRMFGSYDECLQVKALVKPTEVLYRGKYCRAYLEPLPSQTAFPARPMTWGMCMPDTCSQTDTNILLWRLLQQLGITMKSAYAGCDERDYPLDTSAIVAIVICAVFGFLVFAGTAYDIIFKQILKDNKGSKLIETIKYGPLSKIRTHGQGQRSDSEKTPLLAEVSTSGVVESEASYEVGLKGAVEETKPGLLPQLLMSFSAYTNGAKILNTKQPAGSLTAVHGIRFLSMSWVILGHAYMSLIGAGEATAPYIQAAVKRWTFHAIINALVSVDTFFAVSGLLVVYLTMKEMKRNEGKLNWFMFYFHRYWRLTPVYMLCLMLFVCLFHYLSDGPTWQQTGFSVDHCSDTWWTNLLYVNNLIKRDEMCFGWSWYLANDMQFYILSPIIMLPLYYFPIIGYIVFGVFMLAALVTPGVVSRVNNIAPGVMNQVEGKAGNYNDYYMTPYCRMGPYLIGMATGYLLYRVNAKFKMSKVIAICGWLIATAAALAVVYGPYESANGTPMTKDVAALYNAVHRTVWGAAVCWVVFACATGNGGYVNTLLSWEGFVPLSRLSYSAYLIHLPVEMLYTNSLRKPPNLNDINMTYDYLGMLFLSYLVSFVVSLTFEAPMLGLERALLKRDRRN